MTEITDIEIEKVNTEILKILSMNTLPPEICL